MQSDLVSIITPSYKSAKFIAQTIESVLTQTYQNWEMIIVDDCSPDSSNEIIEKYIEKDSRIRLIKLDKNSGASGAKNVGLKNAKGRYISFIDSDDVWEPKKLEIQIKFMQDNNYEVSFTSYQLIDENSDKLNKTVQVVQKLTMEDYAKNTIIGFSTSMIDRKLIDFELKFRDIRIAEDLSFWIDILRNDKVAYGLDNVLVNYRVHSNSLSANKLKSARQILHSYLFIHRLGLFKSFYYFSFYIVNALKKRLLK
ncbi:glycosyl transferase [Malaciobacter halophilus]|nr:glycosyltransferase family 2 protein [Malaciobacter halophilus]RYA23177.1 glycosyl transferase [Malaciobacter halophilus]